MAKDKKLRVQIPKDIADNVMVMSNRTCCVCRKPKKPLQIHHIDENPANNNYSNLAVLCLECHSDTMITGGFGRKLNSEQVIKYRDEWLDIVKKNKDNSCKGISIKQDEQSWDLISFNNQQGIEGAILGIGLNQNYVEACPKLNIFEEALKL